MKHLTRTLGLTALAFSILLPLTAGAQTTPAERHHIADRKYDQQRRIQQGARDGQLTPGETRHLERHQQSMNREEHAMRRAHGGHLTARDRHTLARQQNRDSERIARDKHNLRTDRGVRPNVR